MTDLDGALRYIRESLQHHYRTHGFGLYKITLRESHSAIGLCGFLRREYLPHPDVGYAVLPEFERRGFVSEALGECVRYGFDELGFAQILAIVKPENEVSIHLLLRAGFAEQRTLVPPEGGQELSLYRRLPDG